MTCLMVAGDLPDELLAETGRLVSAWKSAGASVKFVADRDVRSFRPETEEYVLTGHPRSTLELADALGLTLVGPASDWFAPLPLEVVAAPFVITFDADDDQYFVGRTPKPRTATYYVRLIDGEIVSVRVWARGSNANPFAMPFADHAPAAMTADEEALVRVFMARLLARGDVRLPPAAALVVGCDSLGRLILDHMTAAPWSWDGDEDWPSILRFLRRSWRQPGELSSSEADWALRWHKGLLVHPSWTPPLHTPYWYPERPKFDP